MTDLESRSRSISRPTAAAARLCKEYEASGRIPGPAQGAAAHERHRKCTRLVKDSKLAAAAAPAFPPGASGASCRWGRSAPRPKYLVVQRRRDGARHLQGPALPRGRPAPAGRGHDHRRLRRSRRDGRLYLPPLRSTACAARRLRAGHRRGTPPATGHEHPGLRVTTSTFTCTSAPAATCAARRPACSTPSKASAPSRAPSPPIRRLAACGESRPWSTTSRRSAASRRSSNGAEWFQQLAQPQRRRRHQALRRQRPGKRPGLWELPMGTTVPRNDRGTRRRHARRLPLRGCAPRRCLDRLPARRSISTCRWISTASPEVGSRLGTGTIIVLDDRTCPVGMLRNLSSSSPASRAAGARPAATGSAAGRQMTSGGHRGGAGHRRRPRHCSQSSTETDRAGPHLLRLAHRRRGAACRAALKYFRDDFQRAHQRRSDCLYARSAADVSRG